MPYATLADLRARMSEDDIIQLTDDARTGAIDQDRVATALAQADAEIDGYVGAYYRRVDAAAPVPPLLLNIACDIAHYRLFRSTPPTDLAKDLYKEAVAKLRDIARGIIKLDQGEEQLAPRDGQLLVSSSERLFSRDSMAGL